MPKIRQILLQSRKSNLNLVGEPGVGKAGIFERNACVIYKAENFRIFGGMNLISTVIEADADGTLHLPLPKAWQHQSIRIRAELEPIGVAEEHGMAGSLEDLKGFGCLRGKISMSPDFDEPLEDFKDYMA